VAEHAREGHQRRERVVAGAVQEDLLDVGAAQAREEAAFVTMAADAGP
jgi:hypothetical protein